MPDDDSPIVSPVLIGREREQGILRSILTSVAEQGTGRVALVSGEAGVGKSRLASEVRDQAAGAGWTVLTGNCFQRDTLYPYAPLLDALRAYLARESLADQFVMADELGTLAVELVKLLPELTLAVPDLRPSPVLSPEAEKRRLFETLFQFLVRQTQGPERNPLLLILEDIHWSDETSLDFLHLLARRAGDFPILAVATYRLEERPDILGQVLGQLSRTRLATEIALQPLTADDNGTLLRTLFGADRAVAPKFLNAIYALTQGNPFYTEEVVKSLAGGAGTAVEQGEWMPRSLQEVRLPRSLRDLVRRRTEQLSRDAHRLLTLASVMGDRFDYDTVRLVSEQDERTLITSFRELIVMQLIVEEGSHQFAFRHALTRQAMYEDLLGPERRALHRSVGRAIEQLSTTGADGQAAVLAYHFYAAGEWASAYAYAVRAGDQAQALYAPHAAIDHYSHALAAAERMERSDIVGLEPGLRTGLHRRRGAAYMVLSEFEPARADLGHALVEAQEAGHREMEWQTLVDLGDLWASRSYDRTGEYYARALSLARTLGDDELLARSWNRVGNWHLNREEIDSALRAHAEAQALFEGLSDLRGVAQTHDFLGILHLIGGSCFVAERHLRQAISAFEYLELRDRLPSALTNLALTSMASFVELSVPAHLSAKKSLAFSERALRIAREIAWPAGEAYAMIGIALSLASLCRYGEALELAQQGLKIAMEIEHREWICVLHRYLATLYLDLGAFQTGQNHLEASMELALATGSKYHESVSRGRLGIVLLERGETERAEVLLGEADVLGAPMRSWGQRWTWLARAELALARGELDECLRIIDLLQQTAANIDERDPTPIPRLALVKASALARMEQWKDASIHLQAARSAARLRQSPRMLWQIDLALAALYQAQGLGVAARDALSSGQKQIDAIAGSVTDAGLRDQFIRYASSRMPDLDGMGSNTADAVASSEPHPPAGLTAREIEVLRLVARGDTNRDIAAALTISERTVNTHLTNIYNKIDAKNRTAAAAFALQTGLV